jgi:hypothetical protein
MNLRIRILKQRLLINNDSGLKFFKENRQMPFTFAHPVVVLPLGKIWGKLFSLTGLVLGSMAPDFIYFIHFRPDSGYGHCIQGFFLLNLPLW